MSKTGSHQCQCGIYCQGTETITQAELTEKQKNHIWKDIKTRLLVRKLLSKIKSYRRKLRWVHVVNSVEQYAELKCANEAFIEVLRMAHPQIGRITQILKSEGGEEIDCLLIPKEEVESVLDRYSDIQASQVRVKP